MIIYKCDNCDKQEMNLIAECTNNWGELKIDKHKFMLKLIIIAYISNNIV